MRTVLGPALLAAVFGLAACKPGMNPAPDTEALAANAAGQTVAAPAEEAPAVEGVDWYLIDIRGRALSESERARQVFLRLDRVQGQVLGNGGCNRFFGGYQLGSEGLLSFAQVARTQKFCLESIELEDALMLVFEQTGGYRLEAGQLRLLDAERKTLAIFARKPEG